MNGTQNTFRPELNLAFNKMIKGVNVELSEAGKLKYVKANIERPGRWHFISSIHCDESITLCSQSHHMFSGLSLNDIIL